MLQSVYNFKKSFEYASINQIDYHQSKGQQPSTEKVEDSYPTWITQKSGKRVPIVQSSAHTKYFGQLMVTFNDEWKVISAEGNSHLLNRKYAKGNQYYKLIFVR